MRKIYLTETDIKNIVLRLLQEQGDQPEETPEETPEQKKERKKHIDTTKQHITQMAISIMGDIDEVRTYRDEIQAANYHPEDKEELVDLCNYVIKIIHADTSPPTSEEDTY